MRGSFRSEVSGWRLIAGYLGVVLMLIYVLFFTDFFDGEKKRKKNEKKAEASHE